MIRTFTQNDLIRYIYRETTEEENSDLNHQLELDRELRMEVDELRSTLSQLDSAMLEPSRQSIENILKVSRT